jgi:uncharacterized NAD-dependent epimerase/dehydratase family protein
MLGRRRRLVILAEGSFTALEAKTAVCVLRYRPEEVAAVIDSTRAGRTAQACAGVGGGVPVVADLDEAAALGADSLMIGIAPQGGGLPGAWRAMVRSALERGWDVLSGLHVFLADDVELAPIARRNGARIVDARRPPSELRVARARAASLDALVVLTVGSDCSVGKMTTALEIERALLARSVRARFVATGQTGIFIAGSGIAVDAVPADFVAGAAETLVLEAARPASGPGADVVLVEGQGALHHPGFSGVALALLHGAAPGALVLCHAASRDRIRIPGGDGQGVPIPSLRELRDACESAARWVNPAPVVGVSLNTLDLDEPAARAACARAERELGVPASDPVRFGAAPLADAVERRLELRRDALGSRGRG